MLDENYQNKSRVGIFAFTPNELYATVYAKNETGDMWQVMTNRLTPIVEVNTGNACYSHDGNFNEERS